MVVVAGDYFCEYIVMSCGEVTFYNLGYLFKIFNNLGEFGGVVKEYAYVCACLVAERGGIYLTFCAVDYTFCREALEALVDCCARHAKFAGYFEIRLSAILAQFLKNLFINLEILSFPYLFANLINIF